MNYWEPTAGDCWGGRPIARRIADARPRHRVVVRGTIVDARPCTWRGMAARSFGLQDDTGRLTIVMTGTQSIPGMVEGATCLVEGTALPGQCAVVLWSPFYRFEL